MTDNQFKAAASVVDITPDLAAYEIHLHGYGARGSKTAEGVHDPLYGKILVMRQDETLAVLITMDILQIDGLLLDAVVARAAIPGITKGSVALCASHTHSAPAALQKRTQNSPTRLNWYAASYYEYCVDGLAKGLREAVSKLQPARYAIEKTNLGAMLRNRRVPSYSYDTRAFSAPVENDVVVDDEMIVLQFVTDDNEVIATLVNLAAHGTVLGADNMLISADWAGYMQQAVELNNGGMCMYSNGAEGNVAPDCGSGTLGFAEAEAFGLSVSSRVAELTSNMGHKIPEHFGIYSKQLDLPDYQISEQSPFLQAGLDRDFVENFVRETYPQQIQQTLLRLDDMVMLTIPGEMFTELSIEFKNQAKQRGVSTPMILGLANDSIGYMPSADEYFNDGYETGMCVYGPELGAGLINAGLESLEKLYSL